MATRIVTGSSNDAPSVPLRKELGWLFFKEMIVRFCLLQVNDCRLCLNDCRLCLKLDDGFHYFETQTELKELLKYV